MTTSNPSCGSISADIYFEVTDVDCYTGIGTVDVLEYTCLGGDLPDGDTSGLEVYPMPCMVFEPGQKGWAKLVQPIGGCDCHWRAYSLCCDDDTCNDSGSGA